MAAKKAPAKKPAAKRAAKKAAATTPAEKAAKKPATKSAPPVAKPAKVAAQPVEKAARKPAAKPAASNPATANRTRVVIAMDVYEPQKDAFKAPLKERGLKWTFLGEGKGLYKHPEGGIHCFTQFKDDGVHYSLWGADDAGVQAILSAWRALLGESGWAQATAGGAQAEREEQAEQESEALRAWRLAKPQPRAGEPDFFLKKRMAEWEAKKPG